MKHTLGRTSFLDVNFSVTFCERQNFWKIELLYCWKDCKMQNNIMIYWFSLTNNYFCHAVTSQRDRNRYAIFLAMREIFLRSINMVILRSCGTNFEHSELFVAITHESNYFRIRIRSCMYYDVEECHCQKRCTFYSSTSFLRVVTLALQVGSKRSLKRFYVRLWPTFLVMSLWCPGLPS